MVGAFAVRPALLDRAELALLDWRFRLRGVSAPETSVAIAAIDARSVDALGRWPWRRSVIAALIDRLAEAEVAAIGLDVVFSEPETPPEAEPLRHARRALREGGERSAEAVEVLESAIALADTHARLERAIEDSGRVVLGYFFRTGAEDELDGGGATPLDQALTTLRGSRVSVARLPADVQAPILTCTAAEPNLPRFHRAAQRAGFFSALRDADGVVRRAPLVARCGGDLYVSLALGVAEIATGSRAMVLGDQRGIREIRLGDESLRTDEGGRILVNYRGPTATFPHYSVTDILKGRVPREALQGHVVLVGPTEVGIMDIQTTPFGPVFPGVEVHANIVDNLLSASALYREDRLVLAELALLVVLGLLVIAVVPRAGGAGRGALFALGLMALVVAGAVWAFAARGLWINMAYPLTATLGVYLAVAVTQSVTVEARARTIRLAFSTYVPPEVVNEMVRSPESFQLGGERRDLSILFSDVRGFTSLSESIGAEATARLMNEYLTPMTRIVFESRGTLDKYIGDAVVAFWGAPLPVEGHPERACEAAIAMQQEVSRLKLERPDLTGVDLLGVGIGIHAAEVVVGNLGSELRFDYTVSGDGVNLCSRLEGLTRLYEVGIVASADLVARLPRGFLLRELDVVRVKGKREGVRIFEVMGRREASEAERGFLEAYAAALESYRAGSFERAAALFEEARKLRPEGDGACDALLERLRRLGQAPADWDGVFTLEQK